MGCEVLLHLLLLSALHPSPLLLAAELPGTLDAPQPQHPAPGNPHPQAWSAPQWGPGLTVAQVDQRIQTVKVYVYDPPHHLKRDLNLQKLPKEFYFHIESKLLEMFREKSGTVGHIVTNPDEADFFWVPNSLYAHRGNKTYLYDVLLPFLHHIIYQLPYYNRSQGHDHIFVYVWDNGPVCDDGADADVYQPVKAFRDAVWPMIIVGYHGMHRHTRHPHLHSDFRRECFLMGHDITLPQLNEFHLRNKSRAFSLGFLRHKANKDLANMYYRGSIYAEGRLCSVRIRVWTYHYMKTCDTVGSISDPFNRTCGPVRTCGESRGVFALCPAGFGCWSSRFYDAIDRLTIPVVMADGIFQPFERWFDYSTFTVKIITGSMVVHNIHHLQREFHVNRIRYPTMEHLHEQAVSFRRACGKCEPRTSNSTCLLHPVSRKLRSLAAHRPWFSWDLSTPRNALKLFALELYCRTPRGREDGLCRPVVPTHISSWAEYGV